MKLYKISGESGDEEAIQAALKCLRNGGVVMHATETCYGLAADVFNEDALEKLYKLKRMDKNKPVSIMVGSLEEGRKYGEFGEVAQDLAERFWPGPLTLIVPRRDSLPGFFNLGHDTVGIRWPNSGVSLALIEGMGGPLTTTSANVSGMLQVYEVGEFLRQLDEFFGQIGGDELGLGIVPDVVLDSGKIEANLPSTIIKVVGDEFEVIREGDIKV